MKIILQVLLMMLIAFFVEWCIGWYISGNWNPQLWEEASRSGHMITTILFGLFGPVLMELE